MIDIFTTLMLLLLTVTHRVLSVANLQLPHEERIYGKILKWTERGGHIQTQGMSQDGQEMVIDDD